MIMINNLKKQTIEYSGEDSDYSFFIDSMKIEAYKISIVLWSIFRKAKLNHFFEVLNTMRHFK